MIKKRKLLVYIIFVCFVLISCGHGLSEFLYRPNSVSDRSTKIVDLAAPHTLPASKKFTCVIFTDIHFGADRRRYDKEFIDWLKNKKALNEFPSFIISMGDIVEHGKEEEYKQYVSFVADIKKIQDVPVYTALGNHDLHNSGWLHWKKYIYPHVPYYRFKTNKFSWYVIDAGDGMLGEPQLRNLVEEMKADPNPKFVFSHYAIYGGGIPYFVMLNTKERAVLIDTFSRNNVKVFFAGHYHPGMLIYSYGTFSELVVRSILKSPSWVELSIDETNSSFSVKEYK